MKIRDEKRELAARTGLDSHWKDYRRERNMCTKNLSKVKNEHFSQLFEKFENDHDTKNIYNTARKLLKWKTGIQSPKLPSRWKVD